MIILKGNNNLYALKILEKNELIENRRVSEAAFGSMRYNFFLIVSFLRQGRKDFK